VHTYDDTYTGNTSVASATLRSDNTVYARLTLDVGADKVAAMAKRLGVRTPLSVHGAYVPSIGLGSIAVTPLDMASAYATLAARGVYSKPMAITKVVLNNGKVDTKAGWGEPQRKRVISAGVAYEVTKILEENVQSGTGVGAYFGRPAAGKTGTTENHADAWFCGYTPQLEASVWVGYQRAEIPMYNVHGISVAGGTFPATIWNLFMQKALENKSASDFVVPYKFPTFHDWRGDWQYSGGYTPTTTSYYTPTTSYQPTTTYQPTTAVAAAPPPPEHKTKPHAPPPTAPAAPAKKNVLQPEG
jgi:penicillin-binding protein 1A